MNSATVLLFFALFLGVLGHPGETCTAECLRRLSVHSEKLGIRESCARGCRFYVIAEQIAEGQADGRPFRGEACKAMCQESYGGYGFDVMWCKTGCESNTQPSVAAFSWSWFIDGNSMQILQADVPEPDDVLTDPSLRSQIARVETLRIPEIRLRTMPVVTEKAGAAGLCGGGTVRGVPYCLVWSLLLLLTLLGLWSCLSLEETREEVLRTKDDRAPLLPEKHPIV
ncbi:uncharacterized protein LOC106673597 isoform X2 [Cimex lectularius]|uniref:Transmembrane protein 59-like n=1 Tax=Cimex lectularius TaxID=79782 RepID=A0A8I6S8H4_CIMLE|nr:uncharacterized protein LOC106673597 isoform X2 [Cimex lectularius]